MGYSESDIQRQVGPQATAAGRLYFTQRRVMSFEREGDVITGRVIGAAHRSSTFPAKLRVGVNRPACPLYDRDSFS